MTREKAREAAEVMMAYADGKDIEFKIKGKYRWQTWNKEYSLGFDFDGIDYRIKKGQEQESTYRPFKDKEECWNEMQKHQPFGWVSYGSLLMNIVTIDNTDIIYHYDSNFENLDYTASLKYLKFADGTPFGIKEE